MPHTKGQKLSLDNMIMDYDSDRYHMVVLSTLWAKHLSHSEEFRHKPQADVIKESLNQILSGQIKKEDILAAHKADIAKAAEMKDALKDKKLKEPKESKEKEAAKRVLMLKGE